jgi:hypothetical protein
MDADFIDLIFWILVPYSRVLFSFWLIRDCLERSQRRIRTLRLVIIPSPSLLLWFRFKESHAVSEALSWLGSAGAGGSLIGFLERTAYQS